MMTEQEIIQRLSDPPVEEMDFHSPVRNDHYDPDSQEEEQLGLALFASFIVMAESTQRLLEHYGGWHPSGKEGMYEIYRETYSNLHDVVGALITVQEEVEAATVQKKGVIFHLRTFAKWFAKWAAKVSQIIGIREQRRYCMMTEQEIMQRLSDLPVEEMDFHSPARNDDYDLEENQEENQLFLALFASVIAMTESTQRLLEHYGGWHPSGKEGMYETYREICSDLHDVVGELVTVQEEVEEATAPEESGLLSFMKGFAKGAVRVAVDSFLPGSGFVFDILDIDW